MPERERITIDWVSTPGAADAHAAQERAARDAGRGDEDVVAGDEVVRGEDAVDVVAGVDERLPLLVVARPEPALDRAAEALDRGGGDDAFRRAADAHQHVDAGERLRRGDRGRDVAVADQVDARAGLAQLARSARRAGRARARRR